MAPEDGGQSVEACSSDRFMDEIIAFCQSERRPPAPMPGEMGFACTEHAQCDSGICLEPFGSPTTYCTVECNDDGVCPSGYYCDDTTTSLGSVCYRDIGGCDVPDRTVSECIVQLSGEIDLEACFGGRDCASEAAALFACRAGAGPLCSDAELDAACGVEVGLYESCCGPGCDAVRW